MLNKLVKNASAIAIAALYILSLALVAGCKEHEHKYGKWIGTDSGHYRICECGDVWTADHVWDGDSCLVCRFTPDYTLNLAYAGVYDGETLVGYSVSGRGKAEGNELVLPATYDGLPVSVKASAFTGDNMTSLTVLGATEIGTGAFSFCPFLNSAELGNGLISLGQNAFLSCTSLESVALPQSLVNLGSSAFSGCIGLKSITIPDRVENIPAHTFMGCTSLESVNIGAGVKRIDSLAFFNCSSLKYIAMPDGNEVYYAADNGIIERSSQKLIVGSALGRVAAGVKIIGANAFYMQHITELYIPASVELVEINAFSGCFDLQKLYYGGTAAEFGKIVWEQGNNAIDELRKKADGIVFNYNS